jgi:hypothetical protein
MPDNPVDDLGDSDMLSLRFPSPVMYGILQVDYLSTRPARGSATCYTRGSTLSTSGRLPDAASRQPP